MAKKGKRKRAQKTDVNKKTVIDINKGPALISGCLPASRSEAADEADSPLIIEPRPSTLEVFFNGESREEILEQAEQQGEMNRIELVKLKQKKNCSEEDLRDAVFSALLRNKNIKFPPMSQQQKDKDGKKKYKPVSKNKKKLDPSNHHNSGRFRYKESSLNTVLKHASNYIVKDKALEIKAMNRHMNGLLVTTSSLPDLVPFQTNTEGNRMVRMGEFKNKNKYNKRSASKQCFAYLYRLMYYIRVQCGIPLESVYGFGFCGILCNDSDKQYSIGFFKLTAPTHLGQIFRAEQCWESFDPSNQLGVKLLQLYLTSGKFWDIGTAIENQVDPEARIVANFAAPHAYWKKMVKNGTRAMVFKGNLAYTKKILENIIAGNQDLKSSGLVEDVEDLAKKDEGSTTYYVKIRTKDTSYQFDKIWKFQNLYLKVLRRKGSTNPNKLFLDDFLKTYIISPSMDDNVMVVVMADRGERLQGKMESINKTEMMRLCRGLRKYMEAMVKETFHGDFLSHNFLLTTPVTGDEKKLVVIDHDEGGIDSVTKRHCPKNPTWQDVIQYPNALRKNNKEYTRIQFAFSLLQLLPQNLTEDVAEVSKAVGDHLIACGGNNMDNMDPYPKNEIPENFVKLLENVNTEVEKLLGNELGGERKAAGKRKAAAIGGKTASRPKKK